MNAKLLRVCGVFLTLCLADLNRAASAESPPGPALPPPAEIVAKARKAHPRLLALAADFETLKQRVKETEPMAGWRRELAGRARRILGEAPSCYEIPDGLRLLSTSRRVLDRVYTLSLLYRLEGDRSYVERAWKELEAAAGFPDWNPRHFLDTAEMTHAFAIGYDWLFDAWSKEQRDTLRGAMIEKGLKPAQASYQGAAAYGWWMKSRHNWNQVCNGGIGMGALAIADEEPVLAGEILAAALKSLPLAMAEFAPDGAWAEGPGYWNYATVYNVVILAALQTALGTDFGLADLGAFRDTGWFPIYLTGPLGRTFNYADGSDHPLRAPQMFWLAQRFQLPAYSAYQKALATPVAQDLVWHSPHLDQAQAAAAPLDKHFRHAEVVTMRSGWNDRNALFVGFKAGDNKANHSNLDLGTFVLDALGVRWAVDLGADNYNLPAYFGDKRWTYYRLRAEGHNTLVLNPSAEPDQDPAAAARIVRFRSEPDRAFAIADLTAAYRKHARQAQRGVALLQRKRVLVQDEVKAETGADVWWFLHTPAEIKLNETGSEASLSRDGQRLLVKLLSPPGAAFSIQDAQPLPAAPHPPSQAANDGIRKLAVHLPNTTDLRLAVLLVPVRPAGETVKEPAALRPLTEW